MHAAPHCFVPQPHVESLVIAMDLRPYPVQVEEKPFMKLVKTCFMMRRKTLLNNLLSYGLSREAAACAIDVCGLPASVRAEALSLDDFLKLYQEISK